MICDKCEKVIRGKPTIYHKPETIHSPGEFDVQLHLGCAVELRDALDYSAGYVQGESLALPPRWVFEMADRARLRSEKPEPLGDLACSWCGILHVREQLGKITVRKKVDPYSYEELFLCADCYRLSIRGGDYDRTRA